MTILEPLVSVREELVRGVGALLGSSTLGSSKEEAVSLRANFSLSRAISVRILDSVCCKRRGGATPAPRGSFWVSAVVEGNLRTEEGLARVGATVSAPLSGLRGVRRGESGSSVSVLSSRCSSFLLLSEH